MTLMEFSLWGWEWVSRLNWLNRGKVHWQSARQVTIVYQQNPSFRMPSKIIIQSWQMRISLFLNQSREKIMHQCYKISCLTKIWTILNINKISSQTWVIKNKKNKKLTSTGPWICLSWISDLQILIKGPKMMWQVIYLNW